MWELDNKECWARKNWCFWTVLLEKTLESPWAGRRSNQSILKEISPEYSLEGLVLNLKLQYFGHPRKRTDSLEKTLMLGKIEGRWRSGRQWMRWLDCITNLMDMSLSKFWEFMMEIEACRAAVHGPQRAKHDCETELNWQQFFPTLPGLPTSGKDSPLDLAAYIKNLLFLFPSFLPSLSLKHSKAFI